MPWLRRAEITEVVVNRPSESKSGTCPLCQTLDGEPVDEIGPPPFHNHCKCLTEQRQMDRQPKDVLDELFEVNIPEMPPEHEEGGVTDLGDFSDLLKDLK